MRLLLPTAAALLVACGGPASGGGDAAVATDGSERPADSGTARDGGADAGARDAGFTRVPIDDWCGAKAWTECTRDVRCYQLEPSRFDACLRRKLLACDQPAYTSGVKQGRLQYFPAQGAECLNAYARTDCTGVPAACDGLMQGLVPTDGGCILTEECQSGSYCLLYETLCPHRCYPYVALGGACNFWDRQCNPQEGSCLQSDAGVLTCLARLGTGQSCREWSECREDLACIEVKPNDKRCVKRSAKLGESCGEVNGYPACGPDAFCRQAAGTNPPPGTCQQRMGLGGVCAGYSACLPGLRCSSAFATGTCVPLGREGEPCNGYGDCGSELYCATKTSACVALPPDGGNCGATGSLYQCQPGFFCDYEADVCSPRRALDGRCPYDEACLSGACEYGRLDDGGYASRCVAACLTRLDGGF